VFHPVQNAFIRLALHQAAAQGDPGAQEAVTKIGGRGLRNRMAFNAWTEQLRSRMAATDDGTALLAEADATAEAPTPGWFQNLLNWILQNFPQILQDVLSILKLFGI
jgi:hypothetical protein